MLLRREPMPRAKKDCSTVAPAGNAPDHRGRVVALFVVAVRVAAR